MRRRVLLQWATAILASPQLAVAEPQRSEKLHRVSFIATTSPLAEISGADPANPFARAFVHGLRDLGYVQGKNLVLEMRSLEGKPERLEPVVADLVRAKAEVIFLPTSLFAARAKKVAPNTPFVGLVLPSHLIDQGLAQSMARPGGTITGVSIDLDEQLEAKRFELLMKFVPQARRIAYVGLREEWDRLYIRNVRNAAEQRGVVIVHVDSGHGDFSTAFERLRVEQANAVMVERSPRAYGRRREIGQLALASGLATSCSQGELVEEGCLMSYGTDNVDWGRRISVYVDKILKGAKPGDLPIEAPTKFELMINAKTAAKLGIAIPQSILLRADRVIE